MHPKSCTRQRAGQRRTLAEATKLTDDNHTKTLSYKQMANVYFDFDYMQQWAQDGALCGVATADNNCQRCSQQRNFCTSDH